MNLPRSGIAWVTGAGTLVGATGGGTVPYILELSVVSAFPLDPETTVGMGFPTDESFVVSSFTPVAVAKKQCIDILKKKVSFSACMIWYLPPTATCPRFKHLQFGMFTAGVWGTDTGGVIGGGGPGGRKPIKKVCITTVYHFTKTYLCSLYGRCFYLLYG